MEHTHMKTALLTKIMQTQQRGKNSTHLIQPFKTVLNTVTHMTTSVLII